ncbi:MAG: hypothetical protein QOI20_22, partial [Acidimicrobiaceae bacterium]|nr:hypothetical protein [Acidimicrobiaceae bacterium]
MGAIEGAGGSQGAEQALQALAAVFGAGGGQPTNEVAARLTQHLGAGADRMEIVTEPVPAFEHVNLQAALDAYLSGPGRTHELLGVKGGESSGIFGLPQAPQLEALLSGGDSPAAARFGSVEYMNRPCGPDQTRPCVNKGLLLVDDNGTRLAVWVHEEKIGNMAGTTVMQVVSDDIEASRAFLAGIGSLMRDLNIYRGNVLSVSADQTGGLSLSFAERFKAERDAVILPPGVLETLEDQTIGIGELRDRLLAAGRHLKRGLLLYGPPGTGKTHTIRYLTSRLEDYTVFFLTGSMMAALRTVGDLLPRVAPALVVLDDVDLIAEDRERGGQSPRRFLFDL